MKERGQLYQKAKKSGDPTDWVNARKIRNLSNREVKNAKNSYVINQLHINEEDAKKFWETLNEIYPSKKDTSRNTKEITQMVNGNMISLEDTADCMNNFLCTVGSNLANNKPNKLHSHNIPLHPTSFSLPAITLEETIEAIKSIKIYKSSALDGLTSRVLKDAVLVLPDHLQSVFNLSTSTGIFPALWKKANIVLISKEGDSTNPTNYRPISLLPLPGKLLERLFTLNYLIIGPMIISFHRGKGAFAHAIQPNQQLQK